MDKQTKRTLNRVSFCNHLIPTLPFSTAFPAVYSTHKTLLLSMGDWIESEQLSSPDRFHRDTVGRAQIGTGGRGKERLAMSLEHSVASPSRAHTVTRLHCSKPAVGMDTTQVSMETTLSVLK